MIHILRYKIYNKSKKIYQIVKIFGKIYNKIKKTAILVIKYHEPSFDIKMSSIEKIWQKV